MIDAEVEQDLKDFEVDNNFQRRRIITDESELLIMGDSKTLVEIVNTMEAYVKQKEENNPIKRIFILEELIVFANNVSIEKLIIGSIPTYICNAIKVDEIEIKLRGLTLAIKICDRYERGVDLLVEQNCIKEVVESLNSNNQLIKYTSMRVIRSICKYDKKIQNLKKHNLIKILAIVLRDGNIYTYKSRL